MEQHAFLSPLFQTQRTYTDKIPATFRELKEGDKIAMRKCPWCSSWEKRHDLYVNRGSPAYRPHFTSPAATPVSFELLYLPPGAENTLI